jgi:hypothetical protein
MIRFRPLSLTLHPLFLAGTVLLLSFLLAELRIAGIYRESSAAFRMFIALTVLCFVVAAFLTKSLVEPTRIVERYDARAYFLAHGLLLCVTILLNRGTIPILAIFGGTNTTDGYGLVSIPIVYSLIFGWNIYASLRCLLDAITTRSRSNWITYFLTYVPAVLLVSRLQIVILLLVAAVLLVIQARRINVKHISAMVAATVFGLYVFGILGDIRARQQTNSTPAEQHLVVDFIGDFVSARWLMIDAHYGWGYLYFTSPVANLSMSFSRPGECNLSALFLESILPTSVVAAIQQVPAGDLGSTEVDYRVHPVLNVGTTFARPVLLCGVTGAYLKTVFATVFYVVLVVLMKGAKQYDQLALGCILAVVFALHIFDDMFIRTACYYAVTIVLLKRFLDHVRISYGNAVVYKS